MAKTEPKLAEWMVLEVHVELDREYDYKELAEEVVSRIKGLGIGNAQTHGVYSVEAMRLSPAKAAFELRVRNAHWFKNQTTLQELRTLLHNALAGIARDVAEIDRIQSMRKLLPIEPTCTGM
jgi:hypothetical protein